jgi:hypothetical protein
MNRSRITTSVSGLRSQDFSLGGFRPSGSLGRQGIMERLIRKTSSRERDEPFTGGIVFTSVGSMIFVKRKPVGTVSTVQNGFRRSWRNELFAVQGAGPRGS